MPETVLIHTPHVLSNCVELLLTTYENNQTFSPFSSAQNNVIPHNSRVSNISHFYLLRVKTITHLANFLMHKPMLFNKNHDYPD